MTSCSLAFYYSRVLKLPEKEWPRTIIGTIVHAIFESLRNPRHLKEYQLIVGEASAKDPNSVDFRRSKSVARLVQFYQRKHGIAQELIDEINPMLWVGLILIDFHWSKADKDPKTGAPMIYGPEHEFMLTLPDGTQIKGFIDDLAQVGGELIVRDYKSARSKFTANETINSIQAAIYQLYCYQKFGKIPRVEFVFLRHPPTSRTPNKHLQITPPPSPAHLEGLTLWVQSMAARAKQFSLEDALAAPSSDDGFCQRVCTHYAPHPYWVVAAKQDPQGLSPLSSHLSLDAAQKVCESEGVILERHHAGCMAKWPG